MMDAAEMMDMQSQQRFCRYCNGALKRVTPDLVMPGLRWVHIYVAYLCAMSRPAGTYPEPKEGK